MSVTQELNLETVEPYYSSDEWLLLNAIDPKMVLPSEKFVSDINNQRQMGFMQKAKYDNFELMGTNMDESGSQTQGIVHGHPSETPERQITGGFALGALMPMVAPVIGSLIGPAISGLVSLFKKRGSGVYAPNARGSGGVLPPNFRRYQGYGVEEVIGNYIQSRSPALKQMEDQLFGLQGNEFWRNLKNMVKSEIHNITGILPKTGLQISGKVAQHVADRIANQLIPKSFEKIIQKTEKKTGSGGSALGSIIKPVVKWALQKTIKNVKPFQNVRQALHNVDQYLGTETLQDVKKGGSFMSKIKDISTRVLAKALPASSKALGIATDLILNKFGVENTGIREGIEKGLESTATSLGETLGKDIEKEDLMKLKQAEKLERRKDLSEALKEQLYDIQMQKEYETQKKKILGEEDEEEQPKPKPKPKPKSERQRGRKPAQKKGRGKKGCGKKKKSYTVKLL